MRIRRSLPPTAAPLGLKDIWNGFKGFVAGETYLGRLEEGIKEYFGVRHVWLASSGKAALYLVLRAMSSLKPGRSEVLIPAYTCFSVPSAIVRAGLKIALCDIDASSLDFNGRLLADSVNGNTLCVIPNHLFGIPSRMERIMDICRGRDVFVLEDAAQAMGGSCNGRLLGTIGDAGFFSLGRGKLVTCGSGGIIVTNSEVIAGAIEAEFSRLTPPGKADQAVEYIKVIVMSLFIHPSLYWVPQALPFLKLGQTFFDSRFPVMRLSPVQAGLCLSWQTRLERSVGTRRQKAATLCSRLRTMECGEGFSPLPYLRLPVLVENRDLKNSICAAAQEKGLGVTQMYPSAINEIAEIRGQFDGHAFPVARLVAERLVTLPVHEFVRDGDQEEMARLLAAGKRNETACPVDRSSIALSVPGLSWKGRVS